MSWIAMKSRCLNEKHVAHAKYQGKLCPRWQKFENFLADMGERPNKDLSIDRIDNDGDYRPGNCRWATRSEQQRNRGSRRALG
jgi:hypothetical protein